MAYELFGFLAALLLNIPILSLVFYWTNLCGSALWALRMAKVTNKYLETISHLPRDDSFAQDSEDEGEEEEGQGIQGVEADLDEDSPI